MLTFVHPADCPLCSGTLIQMLTQQEKDGYTIGVRYCPNLRELQPDTKESRPAAPPSNDEKCPKKHMLPGMDNKVLAAGGVQCELKPQHNGDCHITIEQATVYTKMAISNDEGKPPKVIGEVPKPPQRSASPKQ
jgi:hypothetical protein